MKQTISTTLAALVLMSIPWAPALAQPAPAPQPAPTPPPAPQPAPTTAPQPAPQPATTAQPPPDTPPSDTPVPGPKPADAQPADVTPPAGRPADTGEDEPTAGKVVPLPPRLKEVFEQNEDLARPLVARAAGFAFWPIALIQAQATPYIGENASFLNGDIAEHPGFRMRRARLGMGASWETLLRAEIQAELLTNAQVSLLLNQAWVGVTPRPWIGAYMGFLDVPFSRSSLSSAADTALIDRPLAVRAIAPQQQLGMYLGGSLLNSKLQYTLGVYNGFQRFDQFYSGYRQPLAGFGNRFDNLAYAARLASSLDTPGPDIPLPGDRKNRANVGASYFYSDGGARDVHAMEADFLFQRAGFRALAEGLYSVAIPEAVPTQPTTQTENIESYGVVVEAGYTFRRVLGAHVRFEWIDANTAVQDEADNWLLTAGVSFMPPVIGKYVKAQLEYTHREEVYGLPLENDSLTIQTQFALQ